MMEPVGVKRLREWIEAIKKAVIEEGGEATPARIRLKTPILSELSEADIIELAKLAPELEVVEHRLHPLKHTTRYYVIRLKGGTVNNMKEAPRSSNVISLRCA